jgi:SpoVK/Ycf46/Vps4 family AAA+-type ATPase
MLSEREFDKLGELTEDFSGSDINIMVNEALMRPVKEVQQATHFRLVERQKLIDQGMVNEQDDFKDEEVKESPTADYESDS